MRQMQAICLVPEPHSNCSSVFIITIGVVKREIFGAKKLIFVEYATFSRDNMQLLKQRLRQRKAAAQIRKILQCTGNGL